MRDNYLMHQVELVIGARKAMLTIREFAQIVGRHPDEIRAMCVSGDIAAVQREKGSHYRIHFAQLDEFLRSAA